MNELLNDVVFSGIVAVRDRLLQLDKPLRLESGEPSFETPDHIKEAMFRALKDNATHYAPSTGIKPLKEAIVRKVARHNKIDYVKDLNNVLVVNGGMHGLYCAFRTLLNPGDEVLISSPYFVEYGTYAANHGGVPRVVAGTADFDGQVQLPCQVGNQGFIALFLDKNIPFGNQSDGEFRRTSRWLLRHWRRGLLLVAAGQEQAEEA